MENWSEKEIYIITKAYPEKSQKYGDSICTAGIIPNMEHKIDRLIRLYPISLTAYKENLREKLSKWSYIHVSAQKSDERLNRYESYKIHQESIHKEAEKSLALKGAKKKENVWSVRKKLIESCLYDSVEELKECKNIGKQSGKNISLGIIKPKEYEWSLRKPLKDVEIAIQTTSQATLDYFWGETKKIHKEADRIDKVFAYKFKCENENCNGHDMICLDWEIFESFRRWNYEPEEKERKLKEKFEITMKKERDLYFILGTTHPYDTFVIIGLFYPPKWKNYTLNGFI